MISIIYIECKAYSYIDLPCFSLIIGRGRERERNDEKVMFCQLNNMLFFPQFTWTPDNNFSYWFYRKRKINIYLRIHNFYTWLIHDTKKKNLFFYEKIVRFLFNRSLTSYCYIKILSRTYFINILKWNLSSSKRFCKIR